MRILSISAQKPHSTGSGVYLSALMAAWQRAGHEQALVVGADREDRLEPPRSAALYVCRFNTPALPFPVAGMSDEMPYASTRYDRMTPAMAEQFCAAFRQTIGRAIAEFQPDLVVCHHLYLLAALVREGWPRLPMAGVCHGTDLRQMIKTDLRRDHIRGQIQRLEAIFAIHDQQKADICRLYQVPPDVVRVIGNGYDPAIFHPRPGLREEKGPLHLVFAGKISAKKGVLSLLSALDHLDYPKDKLRLTLAGGAGDAEAARLAAEAAARCPYPVTFTGQLSQEQLALLFNQGHMLVLPTYYDALPLVLAEALACGMKAICTDLPGIRPWLDQQAPGHHIRFLPPPSMTNADEPDPADLPRFHLDLARAIREEGDRPPTPPPDLTALSWNGVAGRLLAGVPGFAGNR